MTRAVGKDACLTPLQQYGRIAESRVPFASDDAVKRIGAQSDAGED